MKKKKKKNDDMTEYAAKRMEELHPAIPRKSVEIKKAENGFVVSSWGAGRERLVIAKTHAEAQKQASKILSLRKGGEA